MAESSTLERLRQDARDELAALIELRCRLGEDPWAFLPELPSVDEQVVATLREERLQEDRWSLARARAYHPAARPAPRLPLHIGYFGPQGLTLPSARCTTAVGRSVGSVRVREEE